MICSQVEKHWEEWLSGKSLPELERHLEGCPRCRQQADELVRTSAWVGLLEQEPGVPGPAFWVRLRQRLEEGERVADPWEALGWMGARAALVLGVILLLVTLGVWLRAPATAPAVADYDARQTNLDDRPIIVPVGYSELERDQVVLTLVAQTEPQP